MELTSENIWQVYAPIFAKITPKMSRDLLAFASSYCEGRVLDAGCGVGKLFPYLANTGSVTSLLGFDSNLEMLKQAKKMVSSLEGKMEFGVDLQECDINDFAYSERQFDSVVSLNVVYTLKDHIRFFEGVFKTLNPGGRFIVSSPNREMDMSVLEKIVDDEFKDDGNYALFKECNYYLVGQKFVPNLLDLGEVESLLRNMGFGIESKLNNHYHGHNFTIVANKS